MALFNRLHAVLQRFRRSPLSDVVEHDPGSVKEGNGAQEILPIEELITGVKAGQIPHEYDTLRSYTLEEREKYALETKTMVFYFGDEVAEVQKAEVDAALRAAPDGWPLIELNGLNVGCGSRTINPNLCQVDAHRGDFTVGAEEAKYKSDAQILAFCDSLPFSDNTLDFIIALHVLEHEEDPVSVVLDWLRIIRPGGGIGLVLPDYRYTWDARNDHDEWGHRWSPTPEVAKEMFERYWMPHCTLERLDTYPYKISFDIVLRKHGDFVPFDASRIEQTMRGYQIAEATNGALYPPPGLARKLRERNAGKP